MCITRAGSLQCACGCACSPLTHAHTPNVTQGQFWEKQTLEFAKHLHFLSYWGCGGVVREGIAIAFIQSKCFFPLFKVYHPARSFILCLYQLLITSFKCINKQLGEEYNQVRRGLLCDSSTLEQSISSFLLSLPSRLWLSAQSQEPTSTGLNHAFPCDLIQTPHITVISRDVTCSQRHPPCLILLCENKHPAISPRPAPRACYGGDKGRFHIP